MTSLQITMSPPPAVYGKLICVSVALYPMLTGPFTNLRRYTHPCAAETVQFHRSFSPQQRGNHFTLLTSIRSIGTGLPPQELPEIQVMYRLISAVLL